MNSANTLQDSVITGNQGQDINLGIHITPMPEQDVWAITCINHANGAQLSPPYNLDFDGPSDQVAKIECKLPDNGWQFYGKGIELINSVGNSQYHVDVQQTDGQTLLLTLSLKGETRVLIDGNSLRNVDTDNRYIASHVLRSDQKVFLPVAFRFIVENQGDIYMSQDPSIGIRGPRV